MKKDTWKTIIQVVISVLTAALTALGTTSCMVDRVVGALTLTSSNPLTLDIAQASLALFSLNRGFLFYVTCGKAAKSLRAWMVSSINFVFTKFLVCTSSITSPSPCINNLGLLSLTRFAHHSAYSTTDFPVR